MLSFKECRGLELINGETDNLVISEETLPENPLVRYPVLVHTPDMNKPLECHHIELKDVEARALYYWLEDFFYRNSHKTT